jgi:hypothetical protein
MTKSAENEAWLAFLRIRQVPGSNLGLESRYAEEVRDFVQAFQENTGMLVQLGHTISFHTISSSLFIDQPKL